MGGGEVGVLVVDVYYIFFGGRAGDGSLQILDL